jgi:hypothetical protein
MKKSLFINNIVLILSILSGSIFFTGCKKSENPIKFPHGIFPDTVVNLTDMNSEYDEYCFALFNINSNLPIVFSSNRKSSGGQFDLEQASISIVFDQTNGIFGLGTDMTNDLFINKLINKSITSGNDLGPYRLYSSLDGFEYLLLSSENGDGNMDLFYLTNRPVYGSSLPDIEGPYPIKLLNTSYDEENICFDANLDSAYFASNMNGNFDIFLQRRPAETEISSWFNLDYSVSTKADSVNSSSDDECPIVFKKIMVFSSDRPGGSGGFDLYYSIFRNGNWSLPVNLGDGINTSADEKSPAIGYNPKYTNQFIIFSSNRPGGKGGFDLYFTGVEFPEK